MNFIQRVVVRRTQEVPGSFTRPKDVHGNRSRVPIRLGTDNESIRSCRNRLHHEAVRGLG